MAYRTIILKGDPIRKELEAGGAITPGHLVMRNSANKAVVHNEAGGNHVPMFAIEDALQGNTVDDAYVSGNRVHTATFKIGEEVAAILAANQTITVGEELESAGNGTLQAHTVDSGTVIYTKPIVGRALEAVTTTGATARIAVEIA